MKRSPLPRGNKRLTRQAPLLPGGSSLKRVPIERKSELRNTKPLAAAPGPARKPLVAKRPTVTPEERRARRIVKARPADALCERCGRRPGSEYCHRRARSQGGLWCPSNAWWGCSQCHRECHSAPVIAYERGWHVRSTQNPAVVPMWMAGRGLVLLRADGSLTPYREAAA